MFPVELTELDQWVCTWKHSKVPMQALTKKAASSSDPSTWASFQDASRAVEEGHYDYLGFVFNNNGIVGIDIDCGYDQDGFFSPETTDIARHCQSYMEQSRSGRGVHILVKGQLPFQGRNNGQGVEAYQTKRYFIMTGKTLIFTEIIDNQAAIDYLVTKYFPDIAPRSSLNRSKRIYNPIYQAPSNGRIVIQPEYPTIPNGMRNISLTSLAGQLRSTGYPEDFILKELTQTNLKACKPPLPEDEVQAIVASIMRYEV